LRFGLPAAFSWFCGILPSAAFLAAFLGVALARMGYPFELEWMEGGSWLHALRVAQGHSLYPAPSLDFTPFLYPPLYFALAAQLEPLGWLSLPGLRGLSLASTCVTLLLLGRWVWRETRSLPGTCVAAGAYAASFAQSGFFFDLARVDALWLALLLGFAYVLRFAHSPRGHVAAACLAVAAVFAKQQSLGLIAALALAALARDRKQGLVFSVLTALGVAAGFWFLQQSTGGWFGFYALVLPSHHAWEPESVAGFWFRDLGWKQMLPFCAAAMVALNPLLSRRGGNRSPTPTPSPPSGTPAPTLFYPLFFAALFAIAWMSRLHTGGFLNVLMPAHAALALACGLQWPALCARLFPPGFRFGVKIPVSAAAVAVCWLSWAYNPWKQIPSQADREAGIRFVEMLRTGPEGLWIPNHPYLPYMAGKKPLAHRMALEDVLRVEHPASDTLRQEIHAKIAHNSFPGIYLSAVDPVEEALLPNDFRFHYSLQDSVFQGERLFRPRAGVKLRPQYRFTPVDTGL
jgi:hypothetical protein